MKIRELTGSQTGRDFSGNQVAERHYSMGLDTVSQNDLPNQWLKTWVSPYRVD